MMPIDPLPDENGNIVLLSDAIHFRVLTKDVLAEYRKTRGELYTSHFQTCVAAEEFRKAQR